MLPLILLLELATIDPRTPVTQKETVEVKAKIPNA